MTSYEPRMGDYGVVRTGGFFGKLIRLGTVSRSSFALALSADGTMRLSMLAMATSLRLIPLA